jgi:tetratricopeptide (TPR) repeat protein
MHVYLRDYDGASNVLAKLRLALDAALADSPEDESILLAHIEWLHTAIRFVMHNDDDYEEYAYYRQIAAVCNGKKGLLGVRGVQSRLGLVVNYNIWLARGGNPKKLKPEVLQDIQAAETDAFQAAEAKLIELKESGELSFAVGLKRSLMRVKLQLNKPNETAAILRELIDDIPQLPDYHPAELADVWLELGNLYAAFKKFKEAIPCFEQALQYYTEAGEEYEMNAAQAEGLMAECRERMTW